MTVDRSTPPSPAPIRTFQVPRVERRGLGNGITVYNAVRGDLPLVTVRAVIDAGAASERAGEEGLAWLTASALEGGTAQRSGDALAWEIERLGSELETFTTWDALNVEMTTRADRITEALSLLAEIVRTPAFPAREVERMRSEQLAEILRRSTEPRGLADDAAVRSIYAEGATYARSVIGLTAQVESFDAEAVGQFHARRFTPGNTAIVIVGAVTADEAEAGVRSLADIVNPAVEAYVTELERRYNGGAAFRPESSRPRCGSGSSDVVGATGGIGRGVRVGRPDSATGVRSGTGGTACAVAADVSLPTAWNHCERTAS